MVVVAVGHVQAAVRYDCVHKRQAKQFIQTLQKAFVRVWFYFEVDALV